MAVFQTKKAMRCYAVFFFFLAAAFFSCMQKNNPVESETSERPIALVIHGGAGTLRKENMAPGQEELYHRKLQEALASGYDVLKNGGASVDAVISAIKVMEDSPLFNAGKGAVFTSDFKNELDASIMDGSSLMAGAVAGVSTIKNPIVAAHAVMTRSNHVLLSGRGAEIFAEQQGLEIVNPAYFFDSARYRQLLKIRDNDSKFGTVGAVALDKHGNLAAATSTGGMSNKKYGRVGDSPIIGAGTYANNKTCAISCTGHGEYFIRHVVAYDVSALMEYGALSLQQAADSVIMKKLVATGGSGGVIGVDASGNITMTFNTERMYRGYISKEGEARTFIYKER